MAQTAAEHVAAMSQENHEVRARPPPRGEGESVPPPHPGRFAHDPLTPPGPLSSRPVLTGGGCCPSPEGLR